MFIKQLSIFVENKPGRLESIIGTISKSGVNIRALSIADTTDFGVLRLIVDDIDKAKAALNEIGVISKVTDVIAVLIDDRSGGLAKALTTLMEVKINIEYTYAFLGRTSGKAMLVLKANDNQKALEVLGANGIQTACADSI